MATTTTITPKLTEAGREAAFNASLTGIAVEITKISFGGGTYAPTGSETALTDQYAIVTIAGGSSISSTQIRITAVWADAELTEDITEIGIWAGDVLFAVWSTKAGTSIASKTPGTDFVLFCDMVFDQVPADSITVVIDPESSAVLSALATHENDPNAHEQYQLIENLAQAAGPLVWCGTAGGTADALLLTLPDSSTLTGYEAGQAFSFIAASNNDGAMTVNVEGLGEVAVTKAGTNVMVADDIIAGALYEVVYDGTQFQVRSCLAAGRTYETYTYTATAGQTSFSLSYTADLLQVVIDGKTQPPTAFTANDGETVTIGTALTAGQVVHFIVWNVFQVADTYTKAKADATFAPLEDPVFTDNITVTGDSTLGGALAVTGAATLSSTLAVTGAATLSGTFAVTGGATLSSTLAVTGASTLTGAVTAASTLGVTGATTLSSTLAVTGATTLSSTLAVTGAATFSSSITLPSMEIGSLTTANTPYMDFHSSGNNIDYDSRIIASGGSSSLGQGGLTYTANGGHVFNGAVSMSSTLTVSGAVSGASTIYAAGRISNSADIVAGTTVYAGAGAAWLPVDGNVYGTVWGGYLSTWIASKLPTGYITTAGYWRCQTTGLMFQWGLTGSVSNESVNTIGFTTTFPSACIGGFANSVYSAKISGGTNSCYFYPLSTSSAYVVSDGTSGTSAPIFWLAIGY